jgi:hypothetical protein
LRTRKGLVENRPSAGLRNHRTAHIYGSPGWVATKMKTNNNYFCHFCEAAASVATQRTFVAVNRPEEAKLSAEFRTTGRQGSVAEMRLDRAAGMACPGSPDRAAIRSLGISKIKDRPIPHGRPVKSFRQNYQRNDKEIIPRFPYSCKLRTLIRLTAGTVDARGREGPRRDPTSRRYVPPC